MAARFLLDTISAFTSTAKGPERYSDSREALKSWRKESKIIGFLRGFDDQGSFGINQRYPFGRRQQQKSPILDRRPKPENSK